MANIEDYEIDAAAARAGAVDYLLKGRINAPLLERSIRYAIERKRTETELYKAQQFALATVDALLDNIAVLDENGIIIAVNAAWRDFADDNHFIGKNYAVGMNYLEVCDTSHASEGPVVATGIRAVMAGEQKSFVLEYPCHSPSRQRWFEMRATRFTSGEVGHVVVAHENITERKLAAEQLRKSETNLAVAQRIARLGSWEKELRPKLAKLNESPTYWSDEVYRVLGYEPGEIEASFENFRRSIHPDDRQAVLAAVSECLQTHKGYNVECRIVLPDGKERIIQKQARILPSEGSYLPQRLVGTIQDITERSRARAELEAKTLEIITIWESMSDTFLALDSQWHVTYVNSQGESLLQKSRDELLGNSLWELFPDAVGTVFEREYRKAVEQRVKVEFTAYFGPLERWIEIHAYPSTIGLSIYARDITERIQLEEDLRRAHAELEVRVTERTRQLAEAIGKLRIENIERQMAMAALKEAADSLKKAVADAKHAKEEADAANRAKSEFLSRMSHELRTPLNAIIGFGQILERQTDSAVQKESVQFVLKGGQHLLTLINEILDISRVETGRLELSLEPVPVGDVVSGVCSLLQPLVQERNILVEQNISSLSDIYVLADHQRLKQVLMNLLSNAIKYNVPHGRVEVSCDARAHDRIRISVHDTGPGIAPDDIKKLFTPFERLGAANPDIEGSGLGLVLAQRLVTAMRGTLEVQSTVGQGSTFFIELPFARSPIEQLAELPTNSPEASPRTSANSTFSILCIEDNLPNLHLIEAIFEDRPEITLLTAMQGSLGLDLARQYEPDVILLDLHLPDIDGKQVLSRLQQSAVTRDIPVVVISADATPNQIERLLGAGATAYLTKPLDVTKFLQTLNDLLQQNQ